MDWYWEILWTLGKNGLAWLLGPDSLKQSGWWVCGLVLAGALTMLLAGRKTKRGDQDMATPGESVGRPAGAPANTLRLPNPFSRASIITDDEVVHPLRAAGSVATAESLTGGLVGALITALPGAAQVYHGGVVSYAPKIKEKVLAVDKHITRRLGVVSGECAEAMADGARRLLNAKWAVSTTGVAGPGPDDNGTPAGTVFIGLAGPKGTRARKYDFPGDRDMVRLSAAEEALRLLERAVHAHVTTETGSDAGQTDLGEDSEHE